MKGHNPCSDLSRDCFARKYDYLTDEIICSCLTHPYYDDGKCPFCKPEREVTKGKRYPYNPAYDLKGDGLDADD